MTSAKASGTTTNWSGADREFWTFTGCAFRRVDWTARGYGAAI